MVKVHPRSRRPGLQGIKPSAGGPRLQITVTEAAEDGKANRALCAIVAQALRRPQSAVQIIAGAANREKVLTVSGDTASLVALLRAL